MKRTIAILLVMLMALSLFAGAGMREVTWEDYQQWLVDNLAAISPFPEPVSAIVWETGSWEEIEAGYDSGPWGKFFDEDCYNASTWEEFVAAGGVGTFNADFVDLPMGPDETDSASGEASGEAVGEVTWEDYQQWLVDNLAAISPFPEPVSAIVWETGSWEEIEAGYDSGPWGKFFDEDCYNASTWEEFVAAGGVGTFNADFVDLPMGPDETDSASDEAAATVTVNADGTVSGVEGEHISLIVDGVEKALLPGEYSGAVVVTEEFSVTGSSGSGEPPAGGGSPGGASGDTSANTGEVTVGSLTRTVLGTELISTQGADDYRTALYVDADGVREEYSVTEAVLGGSYDDASAEGISVTGESDTFGALVVESVPYELADAVIRLNSASVGGETNDFTGLGAAVSAYGDGTLLEITDSDIETTGVVKPALYISGGADVIIRNSRLAAMGGEVYDTYLSNANQQSMIGAPWHLGINNALGNSRCVNLMGAGTTETVIDSEIYAAGWGGLSVDDGSYMRMDVLNTSVEVDEGYGAFAIAQVTENYYGVNMNAGVLDFIMMGGHVNIGSYTGGDEITVRRMEVKDAGEGIDTYYAQETDEVIAVVSSDAVAEGETVYSTVASDRFGFEMHSMMLNDTVNTITLKENTTLTTGEASFIVKSGFAEITVDNATVTTGASPYTGETVFLQVMDNDDGFCGLTNFQYSAFGEYFWEPDGWSFEFSDTIDTDDYDLQGSAAYDVKDYGTEGSKDLDQWWTKVNLADTAVVGDIWNSTGYWTQGGSDLYVTIGENASVTGVISSGAYQHYAKTYEVGLYGFYSASGEDTVPLEDNAWYNSENSGSWDNSKYISVVDNTPFFYGANGTEVTVQNGGIWNLTGASFVTALTVDGGSIENLAAIYEVHLDVTDRDNQVDAVTVASCEEVAWNGGDIALSAGDNTTIFVLLPAGTDIDQVILVGQSLGIGAKDFEGLYLGSFYDPAVGLLESPMDIY